MINGVLTERSVADVVPILETNQEGLRKTLEELVKQYKSRQEEMEGWKVCCSLFFGLGLLIEADVLGCRRRIMFRLCSSRGSRDGFLEGARVIGEGMREVLRCGAVRESVLSSLS